MPADAPDTTPGDREPVTPLVVCERAATPDGHGVYQLHSVQHSPQQVAWSLAGWEVDNGEYLAYDATGAMLSLTPARFGEVYVLLPDDARHDPAALRDVLERHLGDSITPGTPLLELITAASATLDPSGRVRSMAVTEREQRLAARLGLLVLLAGVAVIVALVVVVVRWLL